jgi:hypothetical protein
MSSLDSLPATELVRAQLDFPFRDPRPRNMRMKLPRQRTPCSRPWPHELQHPPAARNTAGIVYTAAWIVVGVVISLVYRG